MTDKYIKISDLKNKLNYVCRAYGIPKQMKDIINNAISKIPYVVKGELETTLEISDIDSETCIFCGETIPEGRQICPKCEKGV